MTTRHTWRRALAVPAALSLALGGALFGATAANAVPADLIITTPSAELAPTTFEILVAGTVAEGATVTVSKGDVVLPDAVTATVDGTDWATTLTYAPTDATEQTITVSGLLNGEAIDPVSTTFALPSAETPVDPAAFDVTEPAPGAPLTSRTVAFAGTGVDGSTVTATDADDVVLADPATVTDGAWTLEVAFAEDAPIDQVVTFTQLTEGVESGVVEYALLLPTAAPAPEPEPQPEPVPAPEPIPAPATPVITAPVQGEIVVGDRVTFEGTGTPGSDIGLLVVPTAELAELEAQIAEALAALEPQVSTLAQPSPQPAPAAPTDRIIVGDDGTWSVTLEQIPGDYTVVAFAALFDEDGAPVIDPATELPVVSGLSTPVEYSIVAALVPAGTTPVAVIPADSALAYTGSETSGGALGLAGALTLAGVALTLVARRRRALEAVAAE